MDKKTDLDFDFSNITSNVPITAPPKKSTKDAESKQPETTTASGWILTIPTGEYKKWFSRDLSDCTPEEFHVWLSHVFPFHDENADISRFKALSVRKRAVREVAQFHATRLFVQKPPDKALLN